MSEFISVQKPLFEGNEWKYLKDCLDTGWVSSAGNYVLDFENALANFTDSKFAISTSSGTAALHIAMVAADVKENDEVIVPTLTFIATINAVKYCNAAPVFMDCDPQTLGIHVNKVLSFLDDCTFQKKDGFTYNKISKKRIKALLPVHVLGHPVDMDPLISVCKRKNIIIVEDAAESLGSKYKDKACGSIGDMGCFSFNGNKIITAGGGGMVVTDNKKIAQKIKHLTTQARTDSLEYHHDQIGYNYRLSNLHSALGLAQLEQLENILLKKRSNAERFKSLFSDRQFVEFIWEKPWAKSNFWMNTLKIPASCKAPLTQFLLKKGIQVSPIWQLAHRFDMFKACQNYDITFASNVQSTHLNIPSSTSLNEKQIDYIVDNISLFFKTAYAKNAKKAG